MRCPMGHVIRFAEEERVPASHIGFFCDRGYDERDSSTGGLDKVQESMAATVTVSSQFLFNYFLAVNLTPFDGDLLNSSTVSQNVFGGILYGVEAADFPWWSDKQMNVLLH